MIQLQLKRITSMTFEIRITTSLFLIFCLLLSNNLPYSVNFGLQSAEASWSEWSAWSTCSTSCGEGGFQQKTRYCEGENPMSCLGANFDGQGCFMGPCPVDGVWLDWALWTNCSIECGGGIRHRERQCQEPLYGGEPCDGNYNETEGCNLHSCPVDGVWTDWTAWPSCPVSCGGGVQIRNRTCHGPFFGGMACNGTDIQSVYCNTDDCPIHGAWSSWNEWSICSVSCNEGLEGQQRSCSNPLPQYGGLDCPGRTKRRRVCFTKLCPIKGGWSLWSSWSECSLSCGWGTRYRHRTCTSPTPMYGGSFCVGAAQAGASCLVHDCPVDARWGRWGPWSSCSHTCGSNGTYTRTRLCDSPPALYGGKNCTGSNNMTTDCYVTRCEDDGGWSDWSLWSECSHMCETGLEWRNKSCDNPPPTLPHGEDCRGTSNQSRECNTHICPVHGNWTSWTGWTNCPVTCGGDIQTRYRLCINPPPLFEGDPCAGDMNEERDCGTSGCPVDGSWSSWGQWSECSVSCGGGTLTRERTCTNPTPVWGGDDCPTEDEVQQSTTCNEFNCPIHGGWSQWSVWGDCPVTCGSLDIYRSRSCDNPIPEYEGNECQGSEVESLNCADTPCPVNGSWAQWGDWSECTKSCDHGTQIKTRSCSDPSTAHNGFNCVGNQTEEIDDEIVVISCNNISCPIHGGLTGWSEWPSCPVSCGGASITRYRSCQNPEPMHGGDNCTDALTDSTICSGLIQCPIDGNWGRWLDWAPCSKSCETGMQSRIRLCNNPSPLYRGRRCEGSNEVTTICNHFSCPIHGEFSDWTAWEPCSQSCGGGQTSRTRDCTSPAPQHGGLPCYGAYTERRLCAAFYCPVDGGWSNWTPWSECTVTCGGNIVNRTRTCTNPAPKHNGLPCDGILTDWTICANNSCPIDGFWSAWSAWSNCSVPCGEGTQMTIRECDDPPPQHGGEGCVGERKMHVYCTIQQTCHKEIPVPTNMTVSVHVTGKTLTVILEWTMNPPDDSQVEYVILQVNGAVSPGKRRNTSNEWESYAYLPQGARRIPIRDADNLGLFVATLGVRLVVKTEFGERTSQELSFNVAEYMAGLGTNSAPRRTTDSMKHFILVGFIMFNWMRLS